MADFDSVAVIAPASMEAKVVEEIPPMEETTSEKNSVSEDPLVEVPSGEEMPTEATSQDNQPDTKL